MAVVTTKSTAITNLDATPIVQNTPQISRGRRSHSVATVAVANGLLQNTPVREGKWIRFTWSEPGSFPTYAAVVAVGRFRLVSGQTTSGLPVLNVFPKKTRQKGAKGHGKRRHRHSGVAANAAKTMGQRVAPQGDGLVVPELRRRDAIFVRAAQADRLVREQIEAGFAEVAQLLVMLGLFRF